MSGRWLMPAHNQMTLDKRLCFRKWHVHIDQAIWKINEINESHLTHCCFGITFSGLPFLASLKLLSTFGAIELWTISTMGFGNTSSYNLSSWEAVLFVIFLFVAAKDSFDHMILVLLRERQSKLMKKVYCKKMVCEKLTPLSSQYLMRLSSSMEVVPFRKLQKKVKLIIILIIPRTRLH